MESQSGAPLIASQLSNSAVQDRSVSHECFRARSVSGRTIFPARHYRQRQRQSELNPAMNHRLESNREGVGMMINLCNLRTGRLVTFAACALLPSFLWAQ